MVKVTVDKEKCIGCGACASLAPDTFEINSDGKSVVKNASWDDVETVKNAANSCPVQAIEVEE